MLTKDYTHIPCYCGYIIGLIVHLGVQVNENREPQTNDLHTKNIEIGIVTCTCISLVCDIMFTWHRVRWAQMCSVQWGWKWFEEMLSLQVHQQRIEMEQTLESAERSKRRKRKGESTDDQLQRKSQNTTHVHCTNKTDCTWTKSWRWLYKYVPYLSIQILKYPWSNHTHTQQNTKKCQYLQIHKWLSIGVLDSNKKVQLSAYSKHHLVHEIINVCTLEFCATWIWLTKIEGEDMMT